MLQRGGGEKDVRIKCRFDFGRSGCQFFLSFWSFCLKLFWTLWREIRLPDRLGKRVTAASYDSFQQFRQLQNLPAAAVMLNHMLPGRLTDRT